ncbi:dockerin type I domain-containing protein [Blastopirellula marina]|uniref:Alkaline phosphatase n=1 Tax=Blastopirellula marina DSM 3645 TaxID=314230 RepID=A4A1J8_9BACT|nr:dockerin type I domain-containing protein [Blastopirellula marina]EAQ77365.1 alkaline phosphatase [Blastopirellula marina DSM 3645]
MSNSLRQLRPRFETLEAREVLTQFMAVSLVATDLTGSEITSVAVGQAFNLQIWVEDLRDMVDPSITPERYAGDPDPMDLDQSGLYQPDPNGVAIAYVDLLFDGSAFDFNAALGPQTGPGSPAIVFSQFSYNADKSTDGVIEELGAFIAGNKAGNGDPRLWLTVPMVAEDTSGPYEFKVQHPVLNEDFPNTPEGIKAALAFSGTNSSTLYRTGATPLNPEEINYSGATITLNVIEPSDSVEIDLRIVKTATAVNGSGEVGMLPENVAWLDEWDQFYVEIYATAPEGASLQSVSVTIDFTDAFHNVREIIDASDDANIKFVASQVSYASTSNSVSATFNTALNNIGDNNTPALLGRIYFGPDINPGGGVDIDASGDYAEAETTGFVVTGGDANVRYSGSAEPAAVTSGSSAATDIWAVPYDLDDDGSISLIDLTQVIRKIGSPVTTVNNLYDMDFNRNGSVDLVDISLLIRNIGISKTTLSPRLYYSGFPFEDDSAMAMIEGESVGASSAVLLEGESVASESPTLSFEESSKVSDPVATPTSYPLLLSSPTTNSTSQSESAPAGGASSPKESVATNAPTTGGDVQTMLILDAAENMASEDLATDSEAVDEVFADLEIEDLHLTM